MPIPNDVPVLQTERLRLRPLTLEDAPALFPMVSDPETMRFMPDLPHENPVVTRYRLTEEMSLAGARHWAVCRRDSNEPLGIVNYLGQTPIPGMGYILRRDQWGQGLATEACRAALAYGFDAVGFDRVELWINQHNHASMRVAQKLGFRLKSRLAQKYAHEANHHIMLVYGLRQDEWYGSPETAVPPRLFRSEPVLMVHNVADTVAFYTEKLGFAVNFLYGDPPTHAAVSHGSWSGAQVTIQLTQVPPERTINPAGYLYIFTDAQIDALYAIYRQQGVDIVQEPQTYPYGMREFTVRDPNGHILLFGTQA